MKFNKLIPELYVKDLTDSLKFYLDLGFKIEYERNENKFVFLSLQGSQIMIQEQKGEDSWETGKLEHPFGRGINFQIEVQNISPLLEVLKTKNIKTFQQPKENWYRVGNSLLGNKEFLVQDPDGYLLRFFEDRGIKKLK
jgi:catechol 2,3-dioxygenase-like lactoylglutathione lyase family enzyme